MFLQLKHSGRGDLDQVVDACGKHIADKYSKKVERHDHGFHFLRCLRVGEFEADDGDHDLGSGDHEESEELPSNGWFIASIDPLLDEDGDGKCGGGEEKADAHFPQRSEGKQAVDEGINTEGKEGYVEEDEDGIEGLDLRGQPIDIHEMEVHVLGLKHPGGACLVVERPEDGDEKEEWDELAECDEARAAGEFLKEGIAASRDVDEGFTTQPKHEGGDGHQTAGDTEGPMRAIPFEQPWGEQGGEEGTEIDGEVEPVVDFAEEMLVTRAKLIADVSRDAGFDAARADADQEQSSVEPVFGFPLESHEGKSGVAEAIDDAKDHDGAIFPPEDIAQ